MWCHQKAPGLRRTGQASNTNNNNSNDSNNNNNNSKTKNTNAIRTLCISGDFAQLQQAIPRNWSEVSMSCGSLTTPADAVFAASCTQPSANSGQSWQKSKLTCGRGSPKERTSITARWCRRLVKPSQIWNAAASARALWRWRPRCRRERRRRVAAAPARHCANASLSHRICHRLALLRSCPLHLHEHTLQTEMQPLL